MNPQSDPFARLRWQRLAQLLFLLCFLPIGRLRADVDAGISVLTVTNYTGYIISSDALVGSADYNRDHLAVRASIYYNHLLFGGGDTNNTFDYTLHFTLEDDAGVAQPLLVGGRPTRRRR